MRALKAACLALAVSACTVGPDYERPAIETEPLFALQEVITTLNEGKENEPLPADWWRGFKDPTLDAIVKAGLERNFDIAAALADQREAAARLKGAGADYRPQADVSIGADGSNERDLDGSDPEVSGSTDGFLGLSFMPDIFGGGRREREAARAELARADATLKGAFLDTSVRIVRDYLLLRGNQKQLELLRESVQLQEKTLTIVKARYDAGLAPELDVRRAETSVETLRAGIPALERDLQTSLNSMAVLTGYYPGVYQRLLNDAQPVPRYQSPIPMRMQLDVLNARPDVIASEEALKAATAEIGVSAAEFYPKLSLKAQIGIGLGTGGAGPATDFLIGALGALIDQAISNGGARKASLQAAKARADAALARYELSLRQAIADVENALSAIRASHARQTALAKAVKASERSFYQAEILYQRGLISFLNVVDAQRVLANAEQQLANERTTYATRIATLFQVLGTDVTPAKTDPE